MTMVSDGNYLRVGELAELNAQNCALLKEQVRATLRAEHREVVVDLEGLGLIDSCVLGALVAVHKLMAGRSGSLRIVNSSPSVLQIIELTRMHRVLKCTP